MSSQRKSPEAKLREQVAQQRASTLINALARNVEDKLRGAFDAGSLVDGTVTFRTYVDKDGEIIVEHVNVSLANA